ncbi:MAG: PAS domain-containing sensor histidine kinase [Chloroflexota bacterium]|nr:PAS domain-containing sensor histidine kinase [Chloroflexota bacterium]
MPEPYFLLLALLVPVLLASWYFVRRRSGGVMAERVTIPREAEQAQLAADLERLQRLRVLGDAAFDLIGDAVVYLDRERRIGYANKIARSSFGLEEGQPLIESLRDHDLENLLRRCIAQGEEQSAVVQLSRPRRVVRATVRPVGGVGVVMVLNDQTELRHLERVRRDLVANISHELRTPLATLQLLADTVIESAAEDSQARNYFLEKIKEQVTHLSDIVQQSLHLARLESGENQLVTAPVPVHGLVEASVRRIAPRAELAGFSVVTSVAPDLPPVQADFEQVSRVITNMLDNAIKWTPAGGSIYVAAEPEGDFVRFEVRDTGPGVPRDQLPRLFERFYTGDEARSGRGTGLGLSIAKHTVQMHGGRIWVESEEGHGTSFFFTLPTAEGVASLT